MSEKVVVLYVDDEPINLMLFELNFAHSSELKLCRLTIGLASTRAIKWVSRLVHHNPSAGIWMRLF
jgi:hypothetical protein